MLAPRCAAWIGNDYFSSEVSGKDYVESILVNLSLEIPADSAIVVLRRRRRDYSFKLGDIVEIWLENDPKGGGVKVFTGEVDSLKLDSSEIKVYALSPICKLVGLHTNKAFGVGDCKKIVEILAKEVDIEIDGDHFGGGKSLQGYKVDDGSNAYIHIKSLADRSGFDVYTNHEGKLVFDEFRETDTPAARAQYMVNVIGIEQTSLRDSLEGVEVFGEGDYNQSKNANLITKTAKISASAPIESHREGSTNLLIRDPVVHTKKDAEDEAKAISAKLDRGPSATVEILGDPNVRLASTFAIKEMPDSEFNGNYKVTSVEHIFSKVEGFKTTVECSKSKGAGL